MNHQPHVSTELTGMTPDQLRDALGKAQTALTDLLTGNKPVTVMYSQNEGNRSVTFSRANEASLRNFIRELTTALGIGRPRRAMAVRYAGGFR